MDEPISSVLLGERDPWFARNSGKTIVLIVVTLLLAILGIVPSPMSKSIDILQDQHIMLGERVTVLCAHQAKDQNERTECITGVLRP